MLHYCLGQGTKGQGSVALSHPVCGSPLTDTEGRALSRACRVGLWPAARVSSGGLALRAGRKLTWVGRPGGWQQGRKRRESFSFYPRKLQLQCHKLFSNNPVADSQTSSYLIICSIVIISFSLSSFFIWLRGYHTPMFLFLFLWLLFFSPLFSLISLTS